MNRSTITFLFPRSGLGMPDHSTININGQANAKRKEKVREHYDRA
jgi:hypothetical protein